MESKRIFPPPGASTRDVTKLTSVQGRKKKIGKNKSLDQCFFEKCRKVKKVRELSSDLFFPPAQRQRGDSNPRTKGLRDRNSPTCTLSQNGYGKEMISRFGSRDSRDSREGKAKKRDDVMT